MTDATPAATETGAETHLWQVYGDRIYRYLLRLTNSREIAEDLTQETFLLAIRDRRRKGRELDNEKAWLFRIATNLARDHFRRRKLIAWIPFLPSEHEGATPDPAEQVADHELVVRVLEQLSSETAAMLLLKDGEGFSTQEIASMTGHEYEAVKKRLARARLQFRAEYLRLRGGEM